MRSLGLPAANLHAAQAEQVLARLEAQIVADVHRGHQEAHLRGEVAAQGAHPAEQLAALFFVHQGNKLEAYLQGQLLQAQQLGQIGALRLAGLLLLAQSGLGRRGLRNAGGHAAGGQKQPRRHGEKGDLGQPRNQAHRRGDQAGQVERGRLG